LVRSQKSFREKVGNECSGARLWAEVTFGMKFWKRESNRRSWNSAVCSQRPRGGKSRWAIAEPARFQLVANLPVKLLMERFGCRPVKPNHLKSYDRTPAALLWTRFPAGHANCANLLPITFRFAVCSVIRVCRWSCGGQQRQT